MNSTIMNRNLILKSRRFGVRFLSRDIENSPVKLAYVSYDEETPKEKPQKSPIVFIPGFLDTKSNYISLAKSLNKLTQRTIITADCRNHGDSPYAPTMSYPVMSNDVKYLSENLNLKESILMGHSVGAGTVMLTALTDPHFVEKLIVIEGNPIELPSSANSVSDILSSMASVNFEGLQTLLEAKKHADQVLSSSIKSPITRKLVIKHLGEESPGNFKWRMNLPVMMADMPKYLVKFPEAVRSSEKKPFTKPTLFIASGQSGWVQEKHLENIKKLFPNVEFTFFEDAGHFLHFQKPEEFLKIASEFINK